MDNKTLYLEDYKKILELQKKYEDGTITEDDMTIKEIDALYKLYLREIKDLQDILTKKLMQKRNDINERRSI